MIPLKSRQELDAMRKAGALLARIMQRVIKEVSAGISTFEIDQLAEELIKEGGALAAFKGYKGYPSTICTSINEEVVHGIPGARILKEGDIISLDLGLNLKNYFADIAYTLAIGKISPLAKKLIETAERALHEGIRHAQQGSQLSNISNAIQKCAENNGFSVVRQFVGHGIGKNLHEEPEIPNFGRPNVGIRLCAGMVLAIEPMINQGGWECEILEDGWTAITKDGLLSAHFEHTVAVTDNGPEILTLCS